MTTNDAIFAIMATESDLEARRSMEALPFLALLAIISAVAWAYALTALAELMGVL